MILPLRILRRDDAVTPRMCGVESPGTLYRTTKGFDMAHQIAVVADIRRGKRQQVEEMLDQGPPFSLAEHGFTRHHAFLGDTDVVLVFEGDHPLGDARRLAASLGLSHLTKMATLVSNPRVLSQTFTWEASRDAVYAVR